MAKRSRLQIINDILTSLERGNGSLKPTHVMYKSNLSHGQMQGYLKELEEKACIIKETSGRNSKIVLTDEGRKFLQKLRELAAFEEGFGL